MMLMILREPLISDDRCTESHLIARTVLMMTDCLSTVRVRSFRSDCLTIPLQIRQIEHLKKHQ